MESHDTLLEVRDLCAGYGARQVLHGVSLDVGAGEFVGLAGPDGAGKTTLLSCIAGEVKPRSGAIRFMGRAVDGLAVYDISRLGLVYVSQAGTLFDDMPVLRNLRLGAYTERDDREVRQRLDAVLGLFPELAERQHQLAGTLSGGERKMLALGRGLMANARLLMVDEPLQNLSERAGAVVFAALRDLTRTGVAVLLAEPNFSAVLDAADRAYVLEHGRITLQGPCAELKRNETLRHTYMEAK